MPQARIDGLGNIGIVGDQPRFSIPDNAFSDGQNVRAYQGRLRNFGGRTLATTAPIEPYGLFLFRAPDGAVLWLEAGLTAVYAYNGATHTDITRAGGPYIMNEYIDRWTGGIQHTMAAVNNGADGPQMWKDVNITQALEDMIYDPSAGAGSQTWQELGYRCYAMRAYKDTFFAMNLTRGATQLPSTLQWCDFVAPGATTTNWVPAADNSAGEVALGETAGKIIDGAPMRDDFIVYKEDGAFRCIFTGDASAPFAFQRLPDYVRLINRNCIGIAEESHILASRDDVQIFDGNVFRSLLSNRMREYYQTRMWADRQLTTYVASLDAENEIWICIPTKGDAGELKFPDLAIVWNYRNDTISLTDLPQCRDLDQGVIVPPSDDTFDSGEAAGSGGGWSGEWHGGWHGGWGGAAPGGAGGAVVWFDQDSKRFDQSPFEQSREYMVGAHGTSLSILGEATTDDGTPRLCLAERMGLQLTDPKLGYPSTERVHVLRTVRPLLEATAPVTIQAGAQMDSGGPIYWEAEQSFDPRTQDELHFRATGRYFGYRVKSLSDVNWELTGMEFGYQTRRRR